MPDELELVPRSNLGLELGVDTRRLAAMGHVELGGASFDGQPDATFLFGIEHQQREPEEPEVISCNIMMADQSGQGWSARSLLHSGDLYEYFRDASVAKRFVSDLDREEFSRLSGSPAFGPVHTMDDSREYFSIKIGSQEIELRSKYLGMLFHLSAALDGTLTVVVTQMHDSGFEEIPAFIFQLQHLDLLFENRALYCEEDEMWFSEEKRRLHFEKIDL